MSSGRRAKLGFAVVWGLLGGGALFGQNFRQGVEFQVNGATVNNQDSPAVARDADGDFVVTWTDFILDGNGGKSIWGLRFDSAGTVLGNQFRVNTYTSSIQNFSSVAARASGDFVVVWNSFGQIGGISNYTIFGQRFTSAGTTVGVEFQVNAYTAYTFLPKIASDADGDFVVVWQTNFGGDGSSGGVFGRRFNSSGAPLGIDFMVNTFTQGKQGNPAVTADAEGDFVVAWESASQDGQSYGIFGKRFSSAGTPQGLEFRVNSYTLEGQSRPAIAADADGDFLVAWQSLHQDGVFDTGNLGVFARRFSSSGVGQAVEFMVNIRTVNYQRFPEVAADDSGDFVVSWTTQDGSTAPPSAESGVFARRVSGAGTAFGPEFQVNTYTVNGQGEVPGQIRNQAIDFDADGDFVIAWTTQAYQDGNASGIFAQRFTLPPLATLDIDGNGLIDPLTDGLLVLRDHFGFTGPSLTAAAIGPNCSRCDATTITNYLTGLALILDIDNNGALDPLTDGLLTLRFIFGFTGTTLTNNAVAGNCVMRCDAGTILPYLQTLD